MTLLFVLYQISNSKQEQQQEEIKGTFEDNKTFIMTLQSPSSLGQVLEDTTITASFTCWWKVKQVNTTTLKPQTQLYFIVTTRQKRVVVPCQLPCRNSHSMMENSDNSLRFPIDCRISNSSNYKVNSATTFKFGIHTKTVGRTVLQVEIQRGFRNTADTSEDQTVVIYSTQLPVSVVRQVRKPDLGFDCVMPVIMLLISFSVGCTTDSHDLLMFKNYSLPLAVGVICQFIVMPLVGISIQFVEL